MLTVLSPEFIHKLGTFYKKKMEKNSEFILHPQLQHRASCREQKTLKALVLNFFGSSSFIQYFECLS